MTSTETYTEFEYDPKVVRKSFKTIFNYYDISCIEDIYSITPKPITNNIPREFSIIDACTHNAILHGFVDEDIDDEEMEEFMMEEFNYLKSFSLN